MDRKNSILKAIVKHFIETAEPVGSKTIMLSYHFSVSPATIRNDMASLEKEGLIFQPHTSAGRIPTDSGYRLYIDEMVDWESARKEADKALTKAIQSHHIQKAKEKIYDAVALLAQATGLASFATLPSNRRTFYLGLSKIMQEPEFVSDPVRASQVLEVFEENDNFITILQTLDIKDTPRVFIGKENIIPQIQSCSLIIVGYNFSGFKGFIGLLGPTRMKYPFNSAILEKVKKMLEENV